MPPIKTSQNGRRGWGGKTAGGGVGLGDPGTRHVLRLKTRNLLVLGRIDLLPFASSFVILILRKVVIRAYQILISGFPGRLVESNEESMKVKSCKCDITGLCYHVLPSWNLGVDDGGYWGECAAGVGHEVSVAGLRDGVQ